MGIIDTILPGSKSKNRRHSICHSNSTSSLTSISRESSLSNGSPQSDGSGTPCTQKPNFLKSQSVRPPDKNDFERLKEVKKIMKTNPDLRTKIMAFEKKSLKQRVANATNAASQLRARHEIISFSYVTSSGRKHIKLSHAELANLKATLHCDRVNGYSMLCTPSSQSKTVDLNVPKRRGDNKRRNGITGIDTSLLMQKINEQPLERELLQ